MASLGAGQAVPGFTSGWDSDPTDFTRFEGPHPPMPDYPSLIRMKLSCRPVTAPSLRWEKKASRRHEVQRSAEVT